MQLYKSRGFGEFFQDTFVFLKQNGKHFFKHYFIVNGIFLLILMVFTYFFTKFYTDFVFSGLLQGNSTTVVDNYINDNAALFIVLAFLFFIIAIVAGLISYAYTPIYLKLYASNSNVDFDTNAIVDSYKANLGKLLVYLICSILIGIPLLIIFVIGAVALSITIIGILALPFLIGLFMLFYNMSIMEYIENKKGIWESYSYSWSLIKSKFWPTVGSVGLFYLISYVIQNVFTMIPYIFGMASLFTSLDQGVNSQEEMGSTMMIVMLAVFLITFIVSAILSSIVQLNQGIVFYTLKEENENINTKSEIDLIGSGE